MALYTFWGFSAFTAKKKKRTKMCRKQRIVMYLFHFLGHLVLYLNAEDEMLWGLYGCEFAFFFISNGIYKRVYG